MIIGDNGVSYLKNTQAVVFSDGANAPTIPVSNRNIISLNPVFGDVACWGPNNTFPIDAVNDGLKNTIISPAIARKKSILYGDGPSMGIEVSQNGEKSFELIENVEIREWFKRSLINRNYFKPAINSYYWLGIVFACITLTADRSKVAAISAIDPSFCRFGAQNKETGLIDHCYITPDWIGFSKPENAIALPVVRTMWDPVGYVKNETDFQTYILPVRLDTIGRIYYPVTAWNSSIESGWYDVAQSIAGFKKALFENQMSIKYVIKVSTEWWQWRYTGWDHIKQPERNELMKDTLKEFNDFFTGAANAEKSLMVTVNENPTFGGKAGWEVTPLNNSLNSDMHIEDSNEASTHLLASLEVDPVIMGITPGSGSTLAKPSGAEKLIAMQIYLETINEHEEDIMQPLKFIQEYNGWDENITFKFQHKQITTLDSTSSKRIIT